MQRGLWAHLMSFRSRRFKDMNVNGPSDFDDDARDHRQGRSVSTRLCLPWYIDTLSCCGLFNSNVPLPDHPSTLPIPTQVGRVYRQAPSAERERREVLQG